VGRGNDTRATRHRDPSISAERIQPCKRTPHGQRSPPYFFLQRESRPGGGAMPPPKPCRPPGGAAAWVFPRVKLPRSSRETRCGGFACRIDPWSRIWWGSRSQPGAAQSRSLAFCRLCRALPAPLPSSARAFAPGLAIARASVGSASSEGPRGAGNLVRHSVGEKQGKLQAIRGCLVRAGRFGGTARCRQDAATRGDPSTQRPF